MTFIPASPGSWNAAHYPIAMHEAGHAVIADWEDLVMQEARIDSPEPHYQGLVTVPPDFDRLDARLRMVLAGQIAQPKTDPIPWPPNPSAGGDEGQAAVMVRLLGYTKADFDRETKTVSRLLEFLWPARNRVAEALMERGALPGDEVHAIVQGIA